MWRKYRSLVIILVLSSVVGLIGLGKPLDQMLSASRYYVDPIPASGDIVAVGIDKKALVQAGAWPWNRTRYAELMDNLYAAGAKRVVFDFAFDAAGTPEGNAAFSAALARNSKKTWLLIMPFVDGTDSQYGERRFGDHAQFASATSNVWLGGLVQSYDATFRIGGVDRPALPLVLARDNVAGPASDDKIMVDYAIDRSTIPYVSAADVLGNRLGNKVQGRTILIGANDQGIGDMFATPLGERTAGMFIAITGAETLKRGQPTAIGWVPSFAASIIVAYLIGSVKRRRLQILARIAWVMALIVLPIATAYLNLSVEIFPALLVFSLLSAAWSFDRIKKQALDDEIDGLGSVTRAEEEGVSGAAALVCLVINNDAQIRSTLPPEDQKKIWDSLHRRVSFAIGNHPVYRQANCLFWGEDAASFAEIRDRLHGLHAVVRMPTWISGDDVKVEGFFGVDMQKELPLRARIAGAMAAVRDGLGVRIVQNNPVDRTEAMWGLTMSSEINKGLARGDFWVSYQPQLDCRTGMVVGAEALIRWNHPEKGLLNPALFITAAEKAGELGALTEFVLGDVAHMMRAVGRKASNLQWSVNISPRQLADDAVSVMIARHFVQMGGNPAHLTIELTETASLVDIPNFEKELCALRHLGVELSADDYGSGVSTLENLKSSQVRELKIDKQFVLTMRDGNPEYHMVRSTIMMAHALGLRVVAEGVEDQETALLLQRLRCDRAQGYHFAKPMTKKEFLAFVGQGLEAA